MEDYDVIAVVKTQLVPIYIPRLKRLSEKLGNEFKTGVHVNPLPTFRIEHAKGSLFLMKAKEEALLLYGNDRLLRVDPGSFNDISIDWYFSFYFSLLKDLVHARRANGPKMTRALCGKIADSLRWLSRHSRSDVAHLAAIFEQRISGLSNPEWFDVRDIMVSLFSELTKHLLGERSDELTKQTTRLLKAKKGKNIAKNFEYCALALLTRKRPGSLRALFSTRLMVDRYRAALVLLAAAATENGYDQELASGAHSLVEGCLRPETSKDKGNLWLGLIDGILEEWDLAQTVMGL